MADTAHTLDIAALQKRLSQPEHSHLIGPETPGCRRARPSQQAVAAIMEQLRSVLFPGFHGEGVELTSETLEAYVGGVIGRVYRDLREQALRDLCFTCSDPRTDCEERAEGIARGLLERLPKIQQLLTADVQAAYVGDPACRSHDEVILTYPGLLALTWHRIAHELYHLGAPLLARIVAEQAHSRTGIDIHPRATIGGSLFMDHGTGIVIGATTVIGENVRIYQGVTLGAKSFPLDDDGNPIKGIDRHPIVEDDVTIYAGATLLGRITIGRGSVIGGNVWLTRSVPPNSRIAQAVLRDERFREGEGI